MRRLGIQCNYLEPHATVFVGVGNVHTTEMPNKTMTYLRMYCNSFPTV